MHFTSETDTDGFDFRPHLLQNLGVDDIYILACLYEGRSVNSICRDYRRDYSSVRRRLTKIRSWLGAEYFQKEKIKCDDGAQRRCNSLTAKGREFGKACKDFLEIISKFEPQ